MSGVDKKYWGPGTWSLLYSVAFSGESQNFKELVETLAKVLPCEDCRVNYRDYIAKTPITGDLVVWVNNLHNDVRRRTGKQPVKLHDVKKRLDPPPVPRKIVQQPVRRVISITPTLPRAAPASVPAPARKNLTPIVHRPPVTAKPKSAPPAKKGCGCGKK